MSVKRPILPIILALLGFSAMHQSLQAKPLIAAADPWCPFTCTPGSDYEGILVDIVRASLKGSEFTLQYTEQPWARTIADTRRGKITFALGASKDEAPDLVWPKLAQSVDESCFFTNKNSEWTYRDMKDLEHINFAVIEGYSYGSAVDQYVKLHRKGSHRVELVSGVDPISKFFQLVVKGRVHAFLEDPLVVDYNLSRQKRAEFSFRKAGCTKEQQLFAAVSPKASEPQKLSKLLSEGIQRLYKSKEIEKIYSRYGVKAPPLQRLE